MSHNIVRDRELSRIKQALFSEERRILVEIRDLLELHHSRIGTDERLSRSVAQIIAKALRDAGSQRHDELAAAIAPVVMSGVRREILNSRDELIDALHPMLGAMVSAYVTNAIRDFFYGADRRLESVFSPRLWAMRVKSLVTGAPLNELRRKQLVRVEEILLLKKSGLLLDHWQAAPSDGEDRAGGKPKAPERSEGKKPEGLLLSSLLSAINEFASVAFAEDKSELRCLDIGNARIYLRASPAHLIAVKCSGPVTADAEKKIDRHVLDSLARYADELSLAAGGQASVALKRMLPDLADRLAQSLAPSLNDDAPPHRRPVYALAALALLILAGFMGAGRIVIGNWEAAAKQSEIEKINSIIAANPDFHGFPVTVTAIDNGYVISGVAPSPRAAEELTQSIQSQTGVLPVTVNLVSGLLTTTTDTVNGTVRTVTNLLGDTADTVGQTVSQTLNAVQTLTGRILDLERTVATAALDNSIVKLPPAIAELPQKLLETEDRVLTAVNTRLVGDLSNRVQALTGQLKQTATGIGDAATGLTQQLTEDLTSVTTQLANIGQRLNAKAGPAVKPVAAEEIDGLITKVAEAERKIAVLPVRQQVEKLTSRVKEIVSRLGGGPNEDGLPGLNAHQGNKPQAFELKNFEIFDIKDNYDLPLPGQNSPYSSEAAVRYMASRVRPSPLARPSLLGNGRAPLSGLTGNGLSGTTQNLATGLTSTAQNTVGGLASTTQTLTSGLNNTTNNLVGGVTGAVNNVVKGLTGKK